MTQMRLILADFIFICGNLRPSCGNLRSIFNFDAALGSSGCDPAVVEYQRLSSSAHPLWHRRRGTGVVAMPFTTSEQHRVVAVRTPEIAIEFSMDDGGLRSLRRIGGPNMIGHGQPR